MPTLAEFDPRPAALYWMSEKRHRAVEPSKTIQQEWIVQTFREATDIQKLNKKIKNLIRLFSCTVPTNHEIVSTFTRD